MTVVRDPGRIRRAGRRAPGVALLTLLTLLPLSRPGTGAARLIAQNPPSEASPPSVHAEARTAAILGPGPLSARPFPGSPVRWPMIPHVALSAGPPFGDRILPARGDHVRPAPRASIPVLGDSRVLAELGLEIERVERSVREVRRAVFGSRGVLGLGPRSGEGGGLVRLRLQYDPDPGVRFVVLEPRTLIP